jgi:hypothetical protein
MSGKMLYEMYQKLKNLGEDKMPPWADLAISEKTVWIYLAHNVQVWVDGQQK